MRRLEKPKHPHHQYHRPHAFHRPHHAVGVFVVLVIAPIVLGAGVVLLKRVVPLMPPSAGRRVAEAALRDVQGPSAPVRATPAPTQGSVMPTPSPTPIPDTARVLLFGPGNVTEDRIAGSATGGTDIIRVLEPLAARRPVAAVRTGLALGSAEFYRIGGDALFAFDPAARVIRRVTFSGEGMPLAFTAVRNFPGAGRFVVDQQGARLAWIDARELRAGVVRYILYVAREDGSGKKALVTLDVSAGSGRVLVPVAFGTDNDAVYHGEGKASGDAWPLSTLTRTDIKSGTDTFLFSPDARTAQVSSYDAIIALDPTERAVVYVQASRVRLRNLWSGEERVLSPENLRNLPHGSFSPNGRTLAYAAETERGPFVFTMSMVTLRENIAAEGVWRVGQWLSGDAFVLKDAEGVLWVSAPTGVVLTRLGE